MEGLDATVMKLSEVKSDNAKLRYDPEFFGRDARAAYKALQHHRRFGEVVATGYRVIYENTEIIEREVGMAENLPFFLQAADIETPFIRTEGMGCVSLADWDRYPKGRIVPGELLIEVKGLAEKVALVPQDIPPNTLVTGTCYKMTTVDPLDAPLLLAFLTSRPGQALKDRLKSNLLVAFISKEDLFQLPVPNFGRQLKEEIAATISAAVTADKDAGEKLAEAEDTLTAALGLRGWQAPEPLTYTARASETATAARLDAEYYRPQFRAAEEALRRAGAHEFIAVGDLVTTLTNGQTPLHHDLTVGEIPFLCAEHVDDFHITFASDKRVLAEHHAGQLARTAVKVGDVLLTIKGRVGNAAIVEHVPGPVNINQDVALLRFNDRLPVWWIVTFLNNRFGRLQVQQLNTGAINPFLGLGNVRRLRIPRFDEAFMARVVEATRAGIRAAHASKARARALLTGARRAVEFAIEQGETAGLAHLAALDPPDAAGARPAALRRPARLREG